MPYGQKKKRILNSLVISHIKFPKLIIAITDFIDYIYNNEYGCIA